MLDYVHYLPFVRFSKAYTDTEIKKTTQHTASIIKTNSAVVAPLVQPITVIRRMIIAVTIAAISRVSFIDVLIFCVAFTRVPPDTHTP